MTMRDKAECIMRESIQRVMPGPAVTTALQNCKFSEGRLYLVAVGKAAWEMANSAVQCLDKKVCAGIVLTKYGHVQGSIKDVVCYEAGHPVPDENALRGTQAILRMVTGLEERDTVLFLLSGGGSSLFEKPFIPLEELQEITAQLLACGASITEINTIRKHLSQVKGGRFAVMCKPAHVNSIILSDVIGDQIDMIASGPTCGDSSTRADAIAIVEKYHLALSPLAQKTLQLETPSEVPNVTNTIIGSVSKLCEYAKDVCTTLGYDVTILTDRLTCEAREAGMFLGSIALALANTSEHLAFLAGGETVVHLMGKGLGGRNQEIALAAASQIEGIQNVAVFSFGSDGTDGPTDAAGGYVDGKTSRLVDIDAALKASDSYHALQKSGGLLVTGPTGTNVNDLAVVLIN